MWSFHEVVGGSGPDVAVSCQRKAKVNKSDNKTSSGQRRDEMTSFQESSCKASKPRPIPQALGSSNVRRNHWEVRGNLNDISGSKVPVSHAKFRLLSKSLKLSRLPSRYEVGREQLREPVPVK